MPAGNFKQKHAAGRRRDTMPYRRGVPRPSPVSPVPVATHASRSRSRIGEDAKTTAVALSMFDSLLN